MQWYIFQKKLESLSSLEKDPKQFLFAIDAISRDFLSQYYKINRSAKYSDLVHEFRKQGNLPAAQFCHKIQEVMYAGENPTESKLNSLKENLEFLIKEKSSIKSSQPQESEKRNIFKLKKAPELDKRLVNYLSEGLKRGFKIELLRKKLLEAKFTTEEINLAEEHLNRDKPQQSLMPEPIQKQEKIFLEDKKTPKLPKKDSSLIKSLDNLERIKDKIERKTEFSGAKKISEKTALV